MKTILNFLLWLCMCSSLYAQDYFFLPTKEDFLVYSIRKHDAIKKLNYHRSAMRGLLWRPTSDLSYIFAKNIPHGALLMRMAVFDERLERFYYKENFSDFQVVNPNAIVVRTGNNALCLWNLSTGNSVTLLPDFQGLHFYYDIERQLLITQDRANIIVLHSLRAEKQQKFLDKLEEGTHFTVFRGRLTYLNSPTSWVVYNLDNEKNLQYTLLRHKNLRAVWTANGEQFLIKQIIANSPTEIPGWKIVLYQKEAMKVEELYTQSITPQSGNVAVDSNSLITPLEELSTLVSK